jgi:hypothetical protein
MNELAETRVQRMANAARDPIVVLHKFNKLRSREPERIVLVVEGDEDPIFYSVIADRCGLNDKFLSLVAGGKDLVLGFRELLKASVEANRGKGVAFTIDRDFDDLKGFSPGPELYCTPTYSIENIATASSTIKTLLCNEFKLHDPDLIGDVDKVTKLYEDAAALFAKEFYDINLLIYFGRTKSIQHCGATIRDIEDTSNRLFSLDPATLLIKCNFKGDAAAEVVRFTKEVKISDASSVAASFSELEPQTRWRGKFWLSLFIRMTSVLIEDRNSNNPRFFTRGRGKVRLSMATDSVFRLLASACDIPPCMRQYFGQLSANALH